MSRWATAWRAMSGDVSAGSAVSMRPASAQSRRALGRSAAMSAVAAVAAVSRAQTGSQEADEASDRAALCSRGLHDGPWARRSGIDWTDYTGTIWTAIDVRPCNARLHGRTRRRCRRPAAGAVAARGNGGGQRKRRQQVGAALRAIRR